jgi:hypothetical protein
MELLIALTGLALVLRALNVRDQGTRIRFLGSYLSQFKVESLLTEVQQTTMRALAEADPQRQAAIWNVVEGLQAQLCEQFQAFVLAMSQANALLARTSRWPVALPFATQWAPQATFDVRKLLAIHAQGLHRAAHWPGSAKERAFVFMAEMLLLQHSCHWFCRSRLTASARLMSQHQTPFAKALASVSPDTRQAYCALTGLPPP